MIQKRLLAESKLTYQQALDLTQSLETAAKNVKELKTPHGPNAGTKGEEVLTVKLMMGSLLDARRRRKSHVTSMGGLDTWHLDVR